MRHSQPNLRLTIVAMTVGFGSAPYVQMLPEALSSHANVTLVVPEHMPDAIVGLTVSPFRTGTTPAGTLRRSLKPRSHSDFLSKVWRSHPDVIHILNGHGYPWAVALAALTRSTPIVTTLHDPTPHPGNRTDAVNAVLGRYTLSRSRIIHVHDRMFVAPVSARFPGKPVVVVRHPSFASRYLRHRTANLTRTRSVLFFGRIEHYKGIETLLRATALLPIDVHLTIAGAGALSPIEQELSAALGPRLTLLNRFIEDDEAARLLQQASVLALPYLQATQSSLPLIAAAFGLPVVASSVGTFTTEVRHLGGILVPPGDAPALAGALLRQLDAPQPIYNDQETFAQLAPKFLDMYSQALA
jgi:glycosyltransferase involved in cell wall biosynthesis